MLVMGPLVKIALLAVSVPLLTMCPTPSPAPVAYHVIKHTCSWDDNMRSEVRAGPSTLAYCMQMLTVSPTSGQVSHGTRAFL